MMVPKSGASGTMIWQLKNAENRELIWKTEGNLEKLFFDDLARDFASNYVAEIPEYFVYCGIFAAQR